MTVQDAIKVLETHGWRASSSEGDLRQFRRPGQARLVTNHLDAGKNFRAQSADR